MNKLDLQRFAYLHSIVVLLKEKLSDFDKWVAHIYILL